MLARGEKPQHAWNNSPAEHRGGARHTENVVEERRGDSDRGSRFPVTGIAMTLLGIALLAALVLAVDPLRDGVGDALRGDTESLRADLRGLGLSGALIAIALALVHSVLWYPAEILDAAVGYVYDFWVAVPLLMAGWVLNGVVCWTIGRYAARPLLVRWIGAERFETYEGAVQRGGVTLLLGMRLIPVIPFSLFSYAAGSARAPFGRFVWTTAVGYLPITAVFAYLGSRLEELSLDDPILWGGAALLIALLLLTRRVVRSLGIGSASEEAS
jgi:uncharacterized membrane protein YdjX (TVP38/TMEM64 family)